jgi:hypothetical protein
MPRHVQAQGLVAAVVAGWAQQQLALHIRLHTKQQQRQQQLVIS